MRCLTTNFKFRQLRKRPRNLLLVYRNMKFSNFFTLLGLSRNLGRAKDIRIESPAKISQRRMAIDRKLSLPFEEGENGRWISPSRSTSPSKYQIAQESWISSMNRSLAEDLHNNSQLTNIKASSALVGDNLLDTSRCSPSIHDGGPSQSVTQFSAQSTAQVLIDSEISDLLDISAITIDSSQHSATNPPASPSPTSKHETEPDLESMSAFLKDEGLGNDIITFHGTNEHAWVILDCKRGIKFIGKGAHHPSVLFEGQALEVKDFEDTDQPLESEENKKKSPSLLSKFSEEECLRFRNALMEYVDEIFKGEDDKAIFLFTSPQLLIIDPFGNTPSVCQALWGRAMVQIRSGFLSKEDAVRWFETIVRDSELAILLLKNGLYG